MFGLFNKARSDVGAVEGFGKVPALGDFVRTPNPSDELLAFDAWLTRAMETAETRAPGWKEAFASAPAHAFVWSGAIDKKTRGHVVGVMTPSHDAVGRRYPLVIGAAIPSAALSTNPHLAPLLLHDFFQHAAAAAQRAARTQAQAEFHAQVVSIAGPTFDGAAAALARYGSWTKGKTAAALWASLYGADADRATRYALYTIVEATAAYRGQEAPPLSLGVRVPLGAEAQINAAMWLDVVRRAAGWKTTVPSFFVSLGPSPRALIQLGAEVPASVLGDLLVVSRESDVVCDVTAPPGKAPSVLPPAVARAVATPDAPFADVVAQLDG